MRAVKGRISLAVLLAAAFGAVPVKAQSDDLVSAAKHGDLAAVNAMLRAGTDVNERKYRSFGGILGDGTALMQASADGHLEVVQALLAAKADVNATLSEKRDGETALTLAVRKGRVKVVPALLAANADVNHPCCGANALYEAARANNPDMVKALLPAKPDLNRVDPIRGRAALILAIESRYWEVARLLIEAGADVNLPGKIGSPVLLISGVIADYRDCNGSYLTPLGLASVRGNTEIVRALLAAKANPNLAQCDGKTPLALALENNRPDVAELLRGAGATQ